MKVVSSADASASGENHGAARDDECTHDLASLGIPEPVADLGVEGVRFFAPPGRHAIVEAVENLGAVVDRTERVERDALPVGRVGDLAFGVMEGDVEAAVTLPGANKAGERSEKFELIHVLSI